MFATFNTLGIKRPFDSDVLNTPFLYMIDIAFFELLDFLVIAPHCEAKCLIIEEGLSRSLVFDLFSSSFRLGKTSQNLHTCAQFMTWGHPWRGHSIEKHVFWDNDDFSKIVELLK